MYNNRMSQESKKTWLAETLKKVAESQGWFMYACGYTSFYFEKDGETLRISTHGVSQFAMLKYGETDKSIMVHAADDLNYYLTKYFGF